jgi:hypothetical protein
MQNWLSIKRLKKTQQSLTENGQRSGRRNGLGLSRAIVKIDIKFHPYVLIWRQKLREGDPAQGVRTGILQPTVNTVARIPDFLDKLVVSDEAVFSLNSEINSRNIRKYAARGDAWAPMPPTWSLRWILAMCKANNGLGWVDEARRCSGSTCCGEKPGHKRVHPCHTLYVIQRDFHAHNIHRNSMWWRSSMPYE